MISLAAFLRAATIGACVLLILGQDATAAPETGRGGVFSIGIPTADIPELKAEEQAPSEKPKDVDIQSIWALGGEGRWSEAAARLRALKNIRDGWQAPPDLVAYVANGQREHAIGQALASKDWLRVLKLLPEPTANECERPFELWARGDAVEGIGQSADILGFYVRALTNCDDPELVAALAARASSVLGGEGLSALIRLPSLMDSRDPKITRIHAELVRAEAWLSFEAAQAEGNLDLAAALAGSSDDVRLLVQAGWMFLEHDPARAADFFRHALDLDADHDARRGLVMAATAIGDYAGARGAISAASGKEGFDALLAQVDLQEARLLRTQGDWLRAANMAERAAAIDPTLTGEAQEVGGGALLDASARAYDLGNLERASVLAQKAAAYPPVRRAAEMRGAWINLQSGDAELAAAAFSKLYLAMPDLESAEGFALAAQKAGKLDSAAAIARSVGGPLAEKVQAQYASAAFYQGDYLTARALAPDGYDALEGVDHTLYRQSFSMRQQDGARGENRMAGYTSTTSVEFMREASRYEAGVVIYDLDTGAAGERFAAPYLGWSREGETSLAARVGLLPIGAGSDPTITGEVAATRRFGEHMGEARIFVRPRTDSLMAFAGDEAGDTGRVAEAGALVRGRFDIGDGRAVQADISASHLDGRNTLSNSMIAVGASLSQTIAKDGFDYLVTGPFYQFQSYDRNTNFYSAGHGGYFSPQKFHRAGWSVNARTEPLKDWIIKADGAVAFESIREDASWQFPLSDQQGTWIGGGKNSGAAASLDFAMARRLGQEVIMSANLSATASEAFKDLRVGVGLIWVPGGRAKTIPKDLATDPFSPASWIRP